MGKLISKSPLSGNVFKLSDVNLIVENKPQGEIILDSNGIFPVADYAKANVQVPAGSYDIYVTYNDDGSQSLDIQDATYKPDKLQLRIDETNSCYYMFYYYNGGDEVMAEMLAGLDTSNVTDMQSMFSNCVKLTTIDVSNFDTKNVTTMLNMFAYCYRLQTLDLSSFNTSNVTNMHQMFCGCNNLKPLDLSNFDTKNVTNMYSMFHSCDALTSLDLSNFNTSNVIDMGYMFGYCRSLSTIQGTLDLYSATNVYNMFYETRALTGVTLKNIRISLVISSGISYGHLWELPYLINAVKELWDLSASTQQTLTIGSANLEKIADVYVKLVDITDEMIAQDSYAANKLPCIECESTDEGAMTLIAYAGLKN